MLTCLMDWERCAVQSKFWFNQRIQVNVWYLASKKICGVPEAPCPCLPISPLQNCLNLINSSMAVWWTGKFGEALLRPSNSDLLTWKVTMLKDTPRKSPEAALSCWRVEESTAARTWKIITHTSLTWNSASLHRTKTRLALLYLILSQHGLLQQPRHVGENTMMLKEAVIEQAFLDGCVHIATRYLSGL